MKWEYYNARIPQTAAELEEMKKVATGHLLDRLEMLYLLKTHKAEGAKEVAEQLGISQLSFYRWWREYTTEGFTIPDSKG